MSSHSRLGENSGVQKILVENEASNFKSLSREIFEFI